MALDLNKVSESMFAMVQEAAGKKRYKPGDLTKAMLKQYEADGITKKDCKGAIRILVDGEKLIYTYFNGTFLELPHTEGASKA